MTNQEVANLLRQIAKILEIKGDSTFRIRAYEEAATRVENLSEPIEDIWQRGELTNVPGIGESIAAKIEEYLKTGKALIWRKYPKTSPRAFLSSWKCPVLAHVWLGGFTRKLGLQALRSWKGLWWSTNFRATWVWRQDGEKALRRHPDVQAAKW